jgi:hypothetical protein
MGPRERAPGDERNATNAMALAQCDERNGVRAVMTGSAISERNAK